MLGRAFLMLIVVAALLPPRLLAAKPQQRAILVLDQTSAGLPFNTAVASAIRSTINAGSKSPTSFYSEHLDANRFFGPEYENEFVQFLKAKYRETHIDVVIVFGVSALDFIARRREQLWPSVPVVFAAIDEATMSRRTLPNNVTGATMQLTLQDMVNVARIVMPNLKAVAIVGDPLERQTFYRHFAEEIPAVAAQLEIVNLMDLPLTELAKRLAVLPDNTAVLIRTSRVEKFAELSVSDLGPGIPEEKLKEVFEPFFTSKAEGMGMGLSIARTIIEAHHGLILARNRDRGGASFRIRLPLVP